MHSTIVILDYGSQYSQLIARRVRELGFYAVLLSASSSLERIRSHSPRAIILSGGPSSVYEPGAPQLPEGFLKYQADAGIPVLGVCYGMQLLVRSLGGKVEQAAKREYGRMPVIPETGAALFSAFCADGASFNAWMSHGDETRELPPGFRLAARSVAGACAAMENPAAKLYALQFHPEVTHTEGGKELLKNFLLNLAGIQPDWNMKSVLDEQVRLIREKVGPEEHVICGLSGGVDSGVAAVLVHRAIGDRLHCIFVDNGLLRYKEAERVMAMFESKLHLPVIHVDASQRFLKKLEGVTDPERKRKIIGAEFISVFENAAEDLRRKLGHENKKPPEYLVQGTLYPDVIESSAMSADNKKHSVTIKTHHNVGGLPENMRLKLIEPLRDLFKDEVRELGRNLGLADELLKRHPFPGPGLAVRVLGEITQERLEILRQADEIFIQGLRDAGLYDQIWQAFAVFLPIKSVGVQGDGRTHDYVIALRAVTSHDGMTADWFPFDPKFLGQVSAKICNSVRGVNRVVYDISSKPPATIEWE